ncbi:PAP2 superfamily protein [Nocardioides sp. J9]|uniref:phosphatase PAP2 family protein n=1 Tax=unclassified Nocardioides TaxID=2615069 RepID=UPI000684BEF1|nr:MULTISPECIES: phosphatase PAP2 family protein [unclassified Nocardioides]TWH03212.1 PAP2 superfamily protein [Nocardioides sp. J9]
MTTSRTTARRPLPLGGGWSWLVEMGVLVALFTAYNAIRAVWGDDPAAAFGHARGVLRIEGDLFSLVELPLNEWILGLPALAVATCYFYALMHYAMTPLVLLVSRRHGGWHYWRGYWALVLASAIALVGYALLPTAPPRLMPELGTVDVMAHFSEYGWWGSAASAPRGLGDATNQFAAMPSLHFGWSLWCAVQMWGLGRTWWRVAAVAYPTLQVFAVLATANHFVLDVVAGGACVVTAYLVVELVGRVVRRSRDRRAPEPAPVVPPTGDRPATTASAATASAAAAPVGDHVREESRLTAAGGPPRPRARQPGP